MKPVGITSDKFNEPSMYHVVGTYQTMNPVSIRTDGHEGFTVTGVVNLQSIEAPADIMLALCFENLGSGDYDDKPEGFSPSTTTITGLDVNDGVRSVSFTWSFEFFGSDDLTFAVCAATNRPGGVEILSGEMSVMHYHLP